MMQFSSTFRAKLREHLDLGAYVLRWTLLAAPVGALVGVACALFLLALSWATSTRESHGWLLYLLPFAGAGVAALYGAAGARAAGGTDLLMEEIHEPGGGVPRRMAPLIFLATIITHLFGGSAGREGTAVQMGGSLAATCGRHLRLSPRDTRTLLMAGVAAGFGGVFGTPLAGAVFALEVLIVGRISYDALVPCLIAALASDCAARLCGVHHENYLLHFAPSGSEIVAPLQGVLALKVALAAALFGLASVLFAQATHFVQNTMKRFVASPLLRPFAGGCLVIALTLLLGTRDYLGLGVTSPELSGVSIGSSFSQDGAGFFSWLWKLIFTAITLGSGFKGGEVTPLFFIGATLGNALARVLAAPTELFAALGFIAIFAGATNTPLACTLMSIELFGPHYALYFALCNFLAYLFSGKSSIYSAQRLGASKIDVQENGIAAKPH